MDKLELEQCIQQYGKDIYSFCKHLTCNVHEADELYQDTFLKAVELQSKISWQDNPKSYLLSITVRLWKNRRRKTAWRNRIAPIVAIVEEQNENMVYDAEMSPEGTVKSRLYQARKILEKELEDVL